jgi:hypothetical protein
LVWFLVSVSWGCTLSAFLSSTGTFFSRTGAIARRTGAIVDRLLMIARRTGAIIRRLLMIACCSESLLLFSHRLSRLFRIAVRIGAGIPHLGHLITLIRRDISRRCGSQACARLLISEMRRMLTMHAPHVTRVLISPLEGFLIAGGLILVGGRLVAV